MLPSAHVKASLHIYLESFFSYCYIVITAETEYTGASLHFLLIFIDKNVFFINDFPNNYFYAIQNNLKKLKSHTCVTIIADQRKLYNLCTGWWFWFAALGLVGFHFLGEGDCLS